MGKYLTQNSSWFWSSLLINTCIEKNIKRFFIAPGMRNAPLVAALTQKNIPGDITISWAIDERAMSYQALGYVQKSASAACIICTSGTALANFYPAIIEASKSLIPLIVISADRPVELAFHDVNQSIDQTGIFTKFVRQELNLWTAEQNANPSYAKSAIIHTIEKSIFPYPGPIHINIPLSEPLSETLGIISDNIKNYTLTEENKINTNSFEYIQNIQQENFDLIALKNKCRPLIVFGQLSTMEKKDLGINESINDILSLLSSLDVPFLADIASGIKIPSLNTDNLSLPSFDHLETVEYLRKNPPDILLHFGGKLISKNYEQLLNEWSDSNIPLLQFGNFPFSHNPSGHFFNIFMSGQKYLKIIRNLIKTNDKFSWNKEELILHISSLTEKKSKIINQAKWSYPLFSKSLVDFFSQYLKSDPVQLFLGNSTVVRAFDCYLPEKKNPGQNFLTFTQRGVSGIEGNISTAIGIALAPNATKNINIAILGDVAGMHDLNAFFDLSKNKIPLITIIINNGGGGIFTLLPINKSKDISDIITTPHNFNFEFIAKNFNIYYIKSDNKETFLNSFQDAIHFVKEHHSPIILETCFNFSDNQEIYHKLKTRGN